MARNFLFSLLNFFRSFLLMACRFSVPDSSLTLTVELESLSLSVELLLGGDGLRLPFFFFLALGWLLPKLSEDGELDCRLLFSGRLFWLLSAFLALLPRLCFFLPRALHRGYD